jgi:hypothetical protein
MAIFVIRYSPKKELTTETQRHREEKKEERQNVLFLCFFFSVSLCLCG